MLSQPAQERKNAATGSLQRDLLELEGLPGLEQSLDWADPKP